MAGLHAAVIVVVEVLVETGAAVEDTAAAIPEGGAAREKVAGAAEIAFRTKITAIPYASRANHAGKRFALTIRPVVAAERALRTSANDIDQSFCGLPRRKMAGFNFRNG